MKWINDVVFAILAAHVWGSLMLFVWLRAVKEDIREHFFGYYDVL